MLRYYLLTLTVFLAIPAVAMAQTSVPSWTERFDSLDPAVWETQLFSFPANGCNMTAEQVAAGSGLLTLSLAMNPSVSATAPKMCNAGEVGSRQFFTYGLFTVKMKAPAVPGGVSAFFLMNRWQPENWEHREIDIELLGDHPTDVQLTTHDFQNGGRDWKSSASMVDLGLDYSQQFHDYAILWTPENVRWYLDGRLLHTETQYVPHEPLQIRMNIYLGDPNEPGITQWLGPIDATRLPASVQYGAIAYYPLGSLPPEY